MERISQHDLVVRCPRPAPCHSGPTRLRRFLFSARCCSGASTSTHAAHAHRTTWRRFSTSATVRTRSRTRGARVSLGTRPQRRSTETLLDSFSSSSHARPHLTTSPRPVHAQLPRCTWPRRPLSAWASASSPVPSGRYASRPAKFEPRRAFAGPRHPARLTPAETKKYPHGPPSAFLDVRTRPRLTRLPRLLPQNWHWQTKREVEAFYAKGK